MKRVNNLILMVLTIVFFSACSKNINYPYISHKETKIKLEDTVSGFTKNKLGIKKDIILDNKVYSTSHFLLIWPNKELSKTICFDNNICLIDKNNLGYFSHSAIKRKKELYPLNSFVKYKKLEKQSESINEPFIYRNKDIEVGQKIVRIPDFGIVTTKEVGESIYSKINKIEDNSYSIFTVGEVKGYILDAYGQNKYDFEFKIEKKDDLKKWPNTNKNTICIDEICLIDNNSSGTFTHSAEIYMSRLYPLDKPLPYLIKQNVTYNEDSFKYQALYQGKIKDKIKISFREFYDNKARPAFTQDIEYQLNKNKPTIIGFKGLRIKVIKATNLNIKYTIINDYK